MTKTRLFRAVAIGLIVLFIGVCYRDWFALDAMSPYAIYGFQVGFAILVSTLYKPLEWSKASFNFAGIVAILFCFASGFAVFEFAGVLGHSVPYEMRDSETLLFLLLISPVLEEWLYRGVLWRLFERLAQTEWVSLIGTSALFAYSYFQVISSVPGNFHSFVQYQTAYTFGLALFCAGMRVHYGLKGAFAAHLAFNLGFLLGSL